MAKSGSPIRKPTIKKIPQPQWKKKKDKIPSKTNGIIVGRCVDGWLFFADLSRLPLIQSLM